MSGSPAPALAAPQLSVLSRHDTAALVEDLSDNPYLTPWLRYGRGISTNEKQSMRSNPRSAVCELVCLEQLYKDPKRHGRQSRVTLANGQKVTILWRKFYSSRRTKSHSVLQCFLFQKSQKISENAILSPVLFKYLFTLHSGYDCWQDVHVFLPRSICKSYPYNLQLHCTTQKVQRSPKLTDHRRAGSMAINFFCVCLSWV